MVGFPLRVIITAFEIPLGTAFAAAADQEQCEKDQNKYTTSECAADDVLLLVR